MFFRTYPPNPTARRSRVLYTDGLEQGFKPTNIEDDIPCCAVFLDAYDQFMSSYYEDLNAPHTFAVKTHKARRLCRSRRSNTAGSATPTATRRGEQHQPETYQVLGIKQKTNEVSVEQAMETDDSSKSISSTDISASANESEGTNSGMLPTKPPIVVDDDDPMEELATAVILKATWVKLSRATFEKFPLPREIVQGLNP